MAIDARDAAAFYETPLGGMTAKLLRQILLDIWPGCVGLSVLGLGYVGPYLQLWREQSARCIALSPAHMGCRAWPEGRASLACCAEEEALPFADLSFDRILLVHGLEQADNARRTLREAWRLLKDDGRMVIIVPNRRGMWAYAESTPFGHGQPYSQGQLVRLLEGLFFTVERQQPALFALPLQWRANLRAFDVLERAGQALLPQFAGLTIIEATKDVQAVMPLKRRPARRRVLVDVGR
ncbi:MAG TPA: methyltransferase domain-containing protein [Acidocella sp.]|nr:MAG: methyltransferase type 11 [Acidocella sp. 20-58-15]HQT38534.1 methyltransferase domain-containing protein [Acidocella sp.]